MTSTALYAARRTSQQRTGMAAILALNIAILVGGLTIAPGAPAEDSALRRDATTIDSAGQKTVVDGTAQYLTDNYIFPAAGSHAATDLKDNLTAGRYDAVLDRQAFAERLTADIRTVTHDLHIRVMLDKAPEDDADAAEQGPFQISKVDLLKGNIGYIDLRGFLPKDIFAIGANAAIRSLADTDALVLDLRHNHGGDPAAVAYLISFFVDPRVPVHVNDVIWRQPKTETFTRQTFYTEPTPVSYGRKPVYVLISGDTFSGGEELPYDLQSLKRAVIIGQTTGGGANPGRAFSVGQGLSVFIPGGRAENPLTHTNWEGTGVKPDLETTVDAAFATAYGAARAATGHRVKEGISYPAQVVVENRLHVRTTAQPGGAFAVRKQVAGLAAGKQPLDLYGPSLADAMKGPVPEDIQALIVGLGPLKTVTFTSVNWVGEDVYDVEFAHGGLIWNNLLNEGGKVVSTYFTPK